MQRKVHNEVNIIIRLTTALKYEVVCILGGEGRGLRLGEGKASATRGRVCIAGGGRRPPLELGKRAVHILLECFLS